MDTLAAHIPSRLLNEWIAHYALEAEAVEQARITADVEGRIG